jgi:tetratricopeptide (TPR) repeat protein
VAARLASDYLSKDATFREETLIEGTLSQPDVLLALSQKLRGQLNSPRGVAEEAARIHRWVDSTSAEIGVFDEREYFKGEFALIAGIASRLLGQLDEAEIWLDRAEAAFGGVINPAPNLASVAYCRLTVRYDRGKYEHVVSLVPSLLTTFERLEMTRESLKCRFVLAMAYKDLGMRAESLGILEELRVDARLGGEGDLAPLVFINVGELLLSEGSPAAASEALAMGANLLKDAAPSMSLAHLAAVFAEALNCEGRHQEAANSYRSAAALYKSIGMAGREAYIRLALAETLLQMGDARQAEWEVLAALPAIDEQKLEAPARAAIALLAKSARAKATSRELLGQVRGFAIAQ